MKKRLLEKILVPILCTGLAVAMLTPAGVTAFADDEAVTSESTVTSPEEGDADAAADSVTATVGAASDTESTDAQKETGAVGDAASTETAVADNATTRLVRGDVYAWDVFDGDKGSDVFLSNATIPNMKQIYFAIWSVRDGQDDLVWFNTEKIIDPDNANNVYWSAWVPVSAFKPKSGFYNGTYNVHCYAELNDGSMEFINSTTFEVSGHDPVLSINTKTENQTYTAELDTGKEPVADAKQIYFAVWSAVNGQDDLHWLKATEKIFTGYTIVREFDADIQISDFNGSGLYNVHGYAQMADGSMKFLGSTTFTVKGQEQESLAMYRLYNPNSGEHFFTSSQNERDHLVSVGWKYEGTAWKAPKTGTPIYRLYNPNAGDHHYTGSEAEKNNLVKLGWKYEGIAWYSAPASSGKPLYRLYNPNCTGAGAHHYTASTTERDNLVKVGWKYEGIGWYGV